VVQKSDLEIEFFMIFSGIFRMLKHGFTHKKIRFFLLGMDLL